MIWHLPPLYDYALEHTAAHALEHLTFLVVALIFWAQVIPSFPLRPHLGFLWRAGYLFAAALALHLLSVVIAIAAQPIYIYYHTGSDAIADQTAAGAIMDVTGQIVFTTTILICLGLWLRDDERSAEAQDARQPAVAEMSASGALLLAEADLTDSASQMQAPEG